MKTILTMDELVRFCEEQNYTKFSSSETGYELAVRIPATFEIDETDDSNQRGMLRLKYKLFHLGKNRNGSNVSREAGEDALPTIASRPVLAAIHQLDNGEWDFHSHDMEVIENENGEQEIQYIEKQVGSFSGFPEEQPYIAYDEETGKDFVFAYAYIPREYTKSAEIIERKNGTKNSVELHIEEMAYDAKEKYLDLKKFYVSGSTLLGSEPDGTEIGEGMLGSRADIADFKAEPMTFEKNAELIKAIESLNETLSRFNINNTLGKEVEEVKDLEQTKTEELEQASVFDLSDPTEETGDDTTGTESGTTEPATEPATEPTEEPAEEPTVTEPDANEGEGSNEDPVIIDDDETQESKKIGYTIEFNGNTKEFGLSISDKMNAIYRLIDSTYGEEDWYDVELFEEDGYIEMYGWLTGQAYRQQFAFEDDNYSLVGERVEIFRMYVTAEQKAEIEAQKVEFEEVKEKLRKYEEEPQKMEIINSADYSKVFATEEFTELAKQESHFDMSIEEVKAKADSILLDYAKHSNFNLLSENESQAKFQSIPIIQKKVGRYGTLFANNSETKG